MNYDIVTRADLGESVAALTQETYSLKTELKEDICNLRTELKEDISGLRTELKGDIGNLKIELKDDISRLKTELKQDIYNLSLYMNEKFSAIDIKFAEIKGQFDLIKWMMGLILAGMIALVSKLFL